MRNKTKQISKLLLIGIFLLLLVTNIKLSNDTNPSTQNNLIMIAHADNPITEWWESKTHQCISNVPCNQQSIMIFKVNGTWQQTGGGFGAEYQYVTISGTKTECTDGKSVAHCWDCTGTDCYVDPEILIRVLEALNRG